MGSYKNKFNKEPLDFDDISSCDSFNSDSVESDEGVYLNAMQLKKK